MGRPVWSVAAFVSSIGIAAIAPVLLTSVVLEPATFAGDLGPMEHAHQLADAGRLEEAEALIRVASGDKPDAGQWVAMGDLHFLRADFAGAKTCYEDALTAEGPKARAWWGLGRIELAQFHRSAARALIARAYGMAPRDPDIIRSFAEFMPDPKSRTTLLRNIVNLTRESNARVAEDAQGQLDLELRLRGERPGRLASAYREYAIPLAPFLPAGLQTSGVLVPIRINGGKPLRLLLDTGANGIAISARAAKRLELEPVSRSVLGGLGDEGARNAQLTLAKTVEAGELRLDNCVVQVTADALSQGADGVVGASLFGAFEIRLDRRAMALRLIPFPEGAPTDGGMRSQWRDWDRQEAKDDKTAAAYGFAHFLMLRGDVDGKGGLFVVDTGASVTSVAKHFVRSVAAMFEPPALHGAAGDIGSAYRIEPVTVRISGRSFYAKEPVAMDLTEFSRRQGVRVSGILGFPAMSAGTMTINYRDGLVGFGK